MTGIPLVLFYGPNLIRVLVFLPWLTFQLILRGLGFKREGIERGQSFKVVETSGTHHRTRRIPCG